MSRKIVLTITQIIIVICALGCGNSKGEDTDENIVAETEALVESSEGIETKFPESEAETEHIEAPRESIFSIELVDGLADEKTAKDCEILDGVQVPDETEILYVFTSQEVEAELPDYPETAAALEKFFLDKNVEIYSASESETVYEGYTMEYQMEIEKERMDNNVLSFLYGGYYWRGSGTIYNNSYYEGVVFNTSTGQRLKLADVVYDVEKFRKMAVSYIALYLCDELEVMDKEDIDYQWDTLPLFTDEFDDYNWFFTNEGIALICNPDEKESRTVIDRSFVIPYENLYEYLKEEYIPDGVVRAEKELINPVDLLDTLYVGATTDTAVQMSGLDAEWVEYVDTLGGFNVYKACNGSVYFRAYGESPASIEVRHYTDEVTIGGCMIGMSIDECIASLEQYGYYVGAQDDYYCGYTMFNDEEWKEVNFKTLNA